MFRGSLVGRIDDILTFSSPVSFINHLVDKGISGDSLQVSPPLGLSLLSQGTSETLENVNLMHIVSQSSSTVLKSFLQKEEGVDINQIDDITGTTPLMIACLAGHHDVVKVLLKNRADPLICDKNEWNSLHYAIWGMDLKCVKTLLSSMPSLISTKDQWGRTPVMIAASKGNVPVIQLLVKKRADLMDCDHNGRTIIHWAVSAKDLSLLHLLLTRYLPNIEYWYKVDNEGASPLHYAIVLGTIEIVTFLLSKGFDAALLTSQNLDMSHDASHDDGLAPIHWSCVLGSLPLTECLLEHNKGLLTLTSSNRGLQPLHIAATVGTENICDKLIQLGAVVTDTDSSGHTPLHLASKYGNINCVKLLLTHNAEINAQSKEKRTALHLASEAGHAETVNELLQCGSERDRPSGDNNNCPIHLAAIHGHVQIIEILLKYECVVDLTREVDGRTSLHLAAENGHTTCCEYILNQGAELNKKDTNIEGYTSLDLALLNNHDITANYLISQGARTGGGQIHCAATTIQLVWRFHVHKRRVAVSMDWGARIIQYYACQWMDRVRARRLRRIREKRRHEAACIIQKNWLNYINEKKCMEESYFALKTKLTHEYMATHMIMQELEQQARNIHLPSNGPAPSTSTLKTLPSSLPRTSHLLRSGMHPTPLFPLESLLFQQRPKKQLIKSIPPPRIRTVPERPNAHTNRVSFLHTAPTSKSSSQVNTTSINRTLTQSIETVKTPEIASPTDGSIVDVEGLEASTEVLNTTTSPSKEHLTLTQSHSNQVVSLPSITSPVSPLTSPTHQHTLISPKTTTSFPLPNTSTQPLLVSSMTTNTFPLPIISTHDNINIKSSSVASTPEHTSPDPKAIVFPQLPSLHSTAQPSSTSVLESTSTPSTVKDSSLPLIPSSPYMVKEDVLLPQPVQLSRMATKDNLAAEPSVESAAKSKKESKLKRNEDKMKKSSQSADKSSPTTDIQDQALLVQHAQRYNKLQEVLGLLQQAKEAYRATHQLSDDHNSTGYKELKTQIQSALEEAIRLRADTESLHNRIL